MSDTRYPYTYAADLIRCVAGPELSRSNASAICHMIAEVFGIENEMMAKKLANYFIVNEKDLTEKSLRRFVASTKL